VSERFDQLAAKHQQLRLRSEAQRGELSGAAAEFEDRVSGVDRGLGALRKFVRHPAVIMGGVAALAMIGPKRLLSLASRSAMYLSLARSIVATSKGSSRKKEP
jgi:YqjK-like protein